MTYYEELYHHGIKGMKWGVRRYQRSDGSLTGAGKRRYNEKYTIEQRQQDSTMYSRGAVKRINRSMNEGNTLKGARSKEADRISRYREVAGRNRTIGGLVGGILGGVGATAVAVALGNTSRKRGYDAFDRNDMDAMMALSLSSALISVGITAGTGIGRAVGGGATMRAGGYSGKKLRTH